MKKFVFLALLIALSGTLQPASADDAATVADPTGKLALAEEFASLAHMQIFHAPDSRSSWSQGAAYLSAAARLNPDEPRFARELVQQYIYLHDVTGATNALAAYRRLVPTDQTAQVQQIDLYLGRMQQANEKIKYLEQILGREAVPAPVRSDAAVRCAQLLADRAEPAEALRLLTTALTLNPLNLSAMRLRYSLTRSNATPLDTLQQILAMLRANPTDGGLCTSIGQQLADFGLTEDALKWFGLANRFSLKSGVLPSPQYAISAASELIISNQPDAAANLMGQYTTVYGADPDAWTIYLVALQMASDSKKDDATLKATLDSARQKTQIVLLNNLAIIRSAAGDLKATTQPVDSPSPTTMPTTMPVPDLSGDLALLRKAGPQVGSDYLSAISALAWYDLYFRQDATSADPILDEMGKLVTDRDVQLTRLRGWRELVMKDQAGASTKLSAVADRDPLAALGLVLIDLDPQNSARHDQALIAAKQLLQSHPSGPVGAILAGEFTKFGIKVEPTGKYIPIQQVIADFPVGLTRLGDQPGEFYSLRVEPVKTSVEYGEPILVRVTLNSSGIIDLPIGPECGLHSELLFNAIPLGHPDQTIMGAAFDQVDQSRLLLTGQTITVVVRVDDDALYPFLYSHPQNQAEMDIAAITNPMIVNLAESGQPEKPMAKNGLGGLSAQTGAAIVRQAVPLDQQTGRTQLLANFEKQDGGRKIRMLQAMSVYLSGASEQVKQTFSISNPEPPDLKPSISDLRAQLTRSASDSTPAVAAWAKYLLATNEATDDKKAMIEKTAHDADWAARLLALAAAGQNEDGGHLIASELSSDTDLTVNAAATALAQSPPPATRPTTAPGS